MFLALFRFLVQDEEEESYGVDKEACYSKELAEKEVRTRRRRYIDIERVERVSFFTAATRFTLQTYSGRLRRLHLTHDLFLSFLLSIWRAPLCTFSFLPFLLRHLHSLLPSVSTRREQQLSQRHPL